MDAIEKYKKRHVYNSIVPAAISTSIQFNLMILSSSKMCDCLRRHRPCFAERRNTDNNDNRVMVYLLYIAIKRNCNIVCKLI